MSLNPSQFSRYGPAKPGVEFTHRTHLDPTWVPGQGQTRADNPKARYVVSRVARGQVYYKGTDGKGSFKMDRENWDENYS